MAELSNDALAREEDRRNEFLLLYYTTKLHLLPHTARLWQYLYSSFYGDTTRS